MSRILDMARELVMILEETESKSAAIHNELVRLGDLAPGDKFDTALGKFVVLDQNYECGQTKVVQLDFFKKSIKFGDTCDYQSSELRTLFDGEIEETYTIIFGNYLLEHNVNIKTVDNQDVGSICCKVRPLTFDEAREYNGLIVNQSLADWWWTCSPWSSEDRGWKYSIAVASSGGVFGDFNYGDGNGVRPFCILKSDLFVSKVEE